MKCWARDWHVFFLNVEWQTVDIKKAQKMVMKSKITYKMHIKNVCIFDHEKFELKNCY